MIATLEPVYYFVSRGNSIGPYSDYVPRQYNTPQEAAEVGRGYGNDGYTVWHYEWNEDTALWAPVADEV